MQSRRSVLYVPANNPGALAKAPGLDTDVLVYDLEDTVLPQQKRQARENLARHFNACTHSAELIVRINPVNRAAFFDDINWLAARYGLDGLMLPKVRSADEIRMLSDTLSQRNLALPIWIQVETIDAVLNLSELVAALTPGCALVLGAEDLVVEMGINHTPGRLGLLPVLSQLVLFGRKARLSIIDAVYSDLNNELGFRQSCEQAKNLGFDGKSLIHPAQLGTANQVFSPSPGEIEKAQQIIKAWQQKPAHLGVVSMGGQVIEALHVKQAHALLKKANQSKNQSRS